MAIYHFSAQVISRSKGQSSVAAAAYRSGERLTDEHTGEMKFYKREVQPEAMILTPSDSPDWVQDRERLWNEVEKIEKRKDAQLAREINIALPRELSHGQQQELIRDFVEEQFVDKGMIADVCLHRDDPGNPHAHIMLTTREITPDGFGKKNRDWNDRGLLQQWREEWSNHANNALERAGIEEKITHQSHADRNLEELPTLHLGHVAHGMEQKGIQTDRGNINREIQKHNALVVDLQKYREAKGTVKARIHQAQQKEPSAPQPQSKRKTAEKENPYISQARAILKDEPTFKLIYKRLEEIERWLNRLDKNDADLRITESDFGEIGRDFKVKHSLEKELHQKEQEFAKMGMIGSLFERGKKKELASSINTLKDNIHQKEQKISHFKKVLGFTDYKDFKEKEESLNTREKIVSNMEQRGEARRQQKVLEETANILKQDVMQQVAEQYPNNPEMQFLNFETALYVQTMNQKGNKTLNLEDFKERYNDFKDEEKHKNLSPAQKEKASDLLGGIISGIEQAAINMEKHNQKQKNKLKQKQKQHEWEIGG